MWWIISLLLIPLLLIEAVATTFILMVMLNGYPSLPDALVNLYLVCAIGLVPGLSLLAGFLAQKLSDLQPIPLWVSGSATGLAAVALFPISLITLTFALLAAWGML